MIKVLKYNCKDLKFEICNNCNSLLQFKESDIGSWFKGSSIITGIKCPHCLETTEINK